MRWVKQLLLHCQNDLYGTMLDILLYHSKFTKSLASIRFYINLYDPCVANKMIDGSQMIIGFHVDGCKLIHCGCKAYNCMIKCLIR